MHAFAPVELPTPVIVLAPGETSPSRRLRILVAEDDIVSRVRLVRAIQHLGHDAVVTSDGLEAWESFNEHAVDVVIADWLMPGIDGPELCRRVRNGGEAQGYIPFIFLTMLDDKQHALQAMEVGADDYLIKPLDVDDLRARLVAAQRLKRSEDERRRLLEAERRARAAAEAALRTRDEVLMAVTHDLRTPLSVIHASAQLLQRRLAALELGSRVQPLVRDTDRILSGTIRMGKWIDDLVEVQLRTDAPVTLLPTTIDLVSFAQRAVEDHQSTSNHHQISLKTTCTSLVGTWDEFRLRRAIDNLIANAVKFSPNGGEITVTLEEIATPAGAMAALRVQDNGLGIPASDVDTVFSRYHRAGNVAAIAGQGIGLASVRQIVEQQGGTVSVESREGAGSEFTVRLPFVRDHAARANVSIGWRS